MKALWAPTGGQRQTVFFHFDKYNHCIDIIAVGVGNNRGRFKLKTLVELFWFKYSQLKHAIRNGDEKLVSVLDREIEPSLSLIFHRQAASVGELRDQFQFMVDLLREECEDRSCVQRQASYIQGLLDRYFGMPSNPRVIEPMRPRLSSSVVRSPYLVDEGFLSDVILDSIPDRVAVITTDYRYLYSNPVNAEHLNHKPIDLIGRHIIEFIGVQRFENRVKPMLDRCFSGEIVEYNYVSPRVVNGMTHCRMAPCRSGGSKMLGALLTLRRSADGRDPMAA
ncbi:PAS domain-containing protein [Rhizobium sp. TRM95111]|nr:PAS domain-containing protein [Rhizobium alarense]